MNFWFLNKLDLDPLRIRIQKRKWQIIEKNPLQGIILELQIFLSLYTLLEKIGKNCNFIENRLMEHSENHTSLTFQLYMTFSPPHKQILIEI